MNKHPPVKTMLLELHIYLTNWHYDALILRLFQHFFFFFELALNCERSKIKSMPKEVIYQSVYQFDWLNLYNVTECMKFGTFFLSRINILVWVDKVLLVNNELLTTEPCRAHKFFSEKRWVKVVRWNAASKSFGSVYFQSIMIVSLRVSEV